MALISPATKRKIEQKTGLALSDAVNVAMFLLTLFSLIIAIVSVAVAKWTYDAAERGGKEQLNAMNTAADLLKEQTNRLSAADKALTGLLTRAEEDAKHRSELENRRPIITGMIGCGELDFPPHQSYVSLFSNLDRRGDPPAIRVKRQHKGGFQFYICAVLITNSGDSQLNDGFMHLSWNNEREIVGASMVRLDKIGATLPNFDMPQISDTPYSSPTTWQDGGIVLFEKATLYTSKIYGRPAAYRFEIKVPDNIRAFDLNYHLIGSNFPRTDGTVFIDQGERLSAQ